VKLKNFFGSAILFAVFLGITGCASTPSAQSPAIAQSKVSYHEPDFLIGYSDWANTFSKVVSNSKSPFYGFLRVLVNDTALPAYKTGSAYLQGSVLVLEFNGMEEVSDSAGSEITMDKTIWLAVMVRDSSAVETGGWRFMALDGVTFREKPEVDPVTGCYNCHLPQRTNDYVFSRYSR